MFLCTPVREGSDWEEIRRSRAHRTALGCFLKLSGRLKVTLDVFEREREREKQTDVYLDATSVERLVLLKLKEKHVWCGHVFLQKEKKKKGSRVEEEE